MPPARFWTTSLQMHPFHWFEIILSLQLTCCGQLCLFCNCLSLLIVPYCLFFLCLVTSYIISIVHFWWPWPVSGFSLPFYSNAQKFVRCHQYAWRMWSPLAVCHIHVLSNILSYCKRHCIHHKTYQSTHFDVFTPIILYPTNTNCGSTINRVKSITITSLCAAVFLLHA